MENLLDHYYLSFIDLKSVQADAYKQLMISYRDIALLKALYWRMFNVFKYLLRIEIPETIISKHLEQRLSNCSSEDEMQAQLTSGASKCIKANLNVLDQFIQQYAPCFAGKFTPGDFYHIDMYKRKNFIRKKSAMEQSLISLRPISTSFDTYIIIAKAIDN